MCLYTGEPKGHERRAGNHLTGQDADVVDPTERCSILMRSRRASAKICAAVSNVNDMWSQCRWCIICELLRLVLYRVPTPPGKSGIFFLENSRTCKVLEKYPENYAFFIGSNGKQAEIVNVPVCIDFYLLK